MINSPAFIVGITGHMDLDPDDVDYAGDTIRAILDWVTQDPRVVTGVNGLESPGKPLGVSSANVVVMTSLAPGVDQIAARTACDRGIRVLAPVPFPHPLYREASTFKRGKAQDVQRQAEYDTIVGRVGEVNLFHVLRPEDVELDSAGREELLKKDLDDRVRRNYRYRAAGEFIATNCDLLIAVCDRVTQFDQLEIDQSLPIDAQPGAAFVVDARLHGVTPGMLPTPSSLTWSDNGPVVRIFIRNTKREKPENAPAGRDVAVWHPLDSRPLDASDAAWHKHEMDSLRKFASHLEDMNRRLAEMRPVDGEKECSSLLPANPKKPFVRKTWLQRFLNIEPKGEPPKQETGTRNEEQPPLEPCVVSEQLRSVARLRRQASNVNRDADGKVKKLIDQFLLIAFIAVLLLQLSEYWIPGAIAQDDQNDFLTAARVGFFILAAVLVVVSWVLFLRARKGRLDEIQNDYRAIAEALRVQFFWTAAGTGESVDHRYLQRQRNDLSWIRSAVSSVTMPADLDREEFRELTVDQKVNRLRRIGYGWIDEQLHYFQKAAFELGQRKHWLHFFAYAFLTAGILMTFVGIAAHLLHFEEAISHLAKLWGRVALLHVILGTVVGFLFNELIAGKAWRNPAGTVSESERHSTNIWKKTLHWSEQLSHSRWTVFAYGMLLGTATVCTVFCGEWDSTWCPVPVKLNTLVKNVYLSLAALLHSKAAFHFLSQNVRRYQTMIGLFHGAKQRMAYLLSALQDQLDTPSAGDSEKTIRAIQLLLVDLGVEALNENSEWLQMHRTTPPAPLMPVG